MLCDIPFLQEGAALGFWYLTAPFGYSLAMAGEYDAIAEAVQVL